ncbi:hypothetical protein BGZ60DRAFT_74905 [Tricladium varicosporioides]|nr:hypothetical protein BGZ60DRAFT_74905 [Hymenoscyphus varicosporioides]
MTFGANSPRADTFSTPYSVMEKIQVTGFCIQEFIISGLYVYSTKQILKPGATFQKKRFRQVMLHLIYVNILVILMDITLLCTEYANLYEIQITFKGALYSIKLRLEFAILNQLRSTISQPGSSYDNYNGNNSARDTSLTTFNNPQLPLPLARVYTCSASRQVTSPFVGDINDNQVMMTTEVMVHREEQEKKDDRETVAGQVGAKGNRQKKGPSPNSSEVEFAGAGY